LSREEVEPSIVFKGAKEGRIRQESLQNHKEGYPSYGDLAVQKNARFDKDIMLDRIENWWKNHVAKDDKQIYYLLLDSFGVYIT
jgi:hypothetical protein